jgi:cytochrome P450
VAEDVEFHGQTVPAASVLLMMLASVNRDERRFDHPDRFDMYRNIGQHLAFGYGMHCCPGAAGARPESRIAGDEVLNRWPEWEVELDDARRAPTPTARGWGTVPVRIE